MSARSVFLSLSVFISLSLIGLAQLWPGAYLGFAVVAPLIALGVLDILQEPQAIRRNFPIIGHGRYLLEKIRPEINQYFIESNTDGTPFSREQRSLVYQRAKNTTDTLPFGTQRDVYAEGYEWINHSLMARVLPAVPHRVTIGSNACTQPYSSALLNVGAMSYGALSDAAVRALNRGAKLGGFAHNTGEGGISPYHLEGGGDLIWQIGTGYFGARDAQGAFSAERFRASAQLPNVKMIEIKLSQGAKPGHGGILPASKLTRKIADIRGVPMGQDVLSPPSHSAFRTPVELLRFVAQLRELSGGKPVGFKLCVGRPVEFFAIAKAMLQTGIVPDFITVDGAEGGTGAAPLEFSNVVGTPLTDGLILVHNTLTGIGVRHQVKLLASGRIISGFDIAHKLALGADAVYSARGMMFALGCIQARRCNSNDCPTGIATQDEKLIRGLVVSDKAQRVAHYQQNTLHAFQELLGATGLEHPAELRPWHIQRRVTPTRAASYDEIFEFCPPGAFLRGEFPDGYERAWNAACAESFERRPSLSPPRMSLVAS